MNKTTKEEKALLALYKAGAVNVPRGIAVYEALAEAILANALPPGWRLGEERLAALFDVSRTPVREALTRIEGEHLAHRARRRGLVVAHVTPDEVVDVYVIRGVLDGTSARLAAQHASPLDITELQRIHELMASAARRHDYNRMASLNIEFHEALARASHSPLLKQFVDQVHKAVRRFRSTTFSYPGRAVEAIDEHAEIIDAVKQHDQDLAERVARDHMSRALAVRMQMFLEGAREA